MTRRTSGKPIVAIDGPVGAGKSTVARAVAQRLRFRYVDTGAMYRSVAWAVLQHGLDLGDEHAVTALARSLRIDFATEPHGQRVLVDGVDVTEAIRSPQVSDGASVVSVYPGVREAMVAVQRHLGAAGGVVMEGRDIGTVVFPDAEVKVFLDASLAERTRRRFEEWKARGAVADLESVRKAEEERDRRDRTRNHSPLRAAADAVVIDSTGLPVDDVVDRIVLLVRSLAVGRDVGRRLAGLIADVWYAVVKNALWVVCKVLFRLRIEGRWHEPVRGPFIVAANHASAIDPPIVGIALRHKAAYMGKHELLQTPVLGPLLRSIGVFPVRRGEPDRGAIRRSLQVLDSGGVLVMFPEGTRSPDGRLRTPETGAALIALRTGATVLPVAVINSHRILPKGARRPKMQRVTVRMGPPLTAPRIDGRLDHATLEEWGNRIIAEIERLLPPDQRRASASER